MSTENESTFDKVIRSNSKSESTPIKNDNSRTWSTLLSINKPQTSSIKKLDFSYKRPIDLYSRFTDCDLSAKRFKLNNIDNFQKNEPLTLRRTPSKISLSTPSTISTGFLADFKCLAPYDKLSGRDSPTSSLNNLNLSNKNSDSFFYPGKTTFGGANLRKNIRRFTTTPYSRANVKCIEPVQLKSNLIKSSQDLPLSSVTQRILDRLEKSATPIQDAKSRISTLINTSKSRLFDTTNPSEDNKGRCKVDFDYKPLKYILKKATENQGEKLENTDNKNDNLLGQIEKLNQIKQAEIDLLKDNEKERSNENIFISRKDVTSGKITSRDVKKQRKINDIGEDDADYLKSFKNVQPLLISSTLKPFTLKSQVKDSNDSNNKESMFSFSSPKLVGTFSSANSPTIELSFSSSPKNISNENETPKSAPIKSIDSGDIFKSKTDPIVSHGSLSQLITKSQSNIWFCPTCSTKNELDVDKCVSCEEINPKTAQNKETSFKPTVDTTKFLNQLFKKDNSKNWTCPTCSVSNDINENVCVSCEEVNPNKKPQIVQAKQTDGSLFESNLTKDKPPLSDLFKKDSSKNWSCPTCMVSNESNATKCVSCEEVNPNNSVKQAPAFGTNKFEFKFGSFDSMKKDSIGKPAEELKDSKSSVCQGWICFYCKAENDSIKNICDQCKKVKVVAATKDQVHKFYETQTFKFGSKSSDIFKPTLMETKETSDLSSVPKIEKTDDSSKITTALISKDIDSNLSDDKNKPEQDTGFGFKFSNIPKTTSTVKFGSNDATSIQSFPSLQLPTTSLTFNTSGQTSNEPLFKFPKVSESSSVPQPSFGLEAKSSKPSLEIPVSKTENILTTTTTATVTTNVSSLSTNTSFGQKFSLTTSNDSNLKAPSLFSFSKDVPSSSSTSSTTTSTTTFLSSTTTASEKAPLFLFGNSSLNPATTSSTIMTSTIPTFGKNFGSPINVPKIDIGPPGSLTQEINITFPKDKTLNTNPGFDFGSKSNAFSNQSVFGSIPSSFNFMGTSGNTNQQSLFSFGAKPSNLGSQTPMMKPQSGFTFGTPANNTLTFNSVASQPPPALIEPQTNQPVMPTFNSMIPPPANEPFKFGQSFSSFDNQDSCNTTNNNSNCFSFLANADQFSGGNANPKRTIKKAKRRLPTKP